MRRAGPWLLAALAWGAGTPEALAGTCALCRQSLASGGNDGLVRGFYWSILLIAGMPFALAALVFWLLRRRRRAKKDV